ncbi:MAG: xanthine dehydrogenase family protein molybdopterin-binding subunit [Deltaproteobacteria bacterium]|nr:xanthine dehydrogenase family protein molybdopterin-binding subunit [Deltaproteobacteria bacterium]
MVSSRSLSRRAFLVRSAAVSGGLMVGVCFPKAVLAKKAQKAAAALGPEVTAWVLVNPDDTILIRVARTEMGQGSFTGLPMLIAEELACDWKQVRAEYASTTEHLRRDRIYKDMLTGGSRSIRDSHEYLRKAGAAARTMLITAAAQKWGVPPAECTAASGVITHGSSKRTVKFGAVASDAAKLDIPQDVPLKDSREWKLIGQPVARFDIPDKVTGKTAFAIDTQLPGLVYAAIAQCPVFGGTLKSAAADKISSKPGIVKVVPMDNAVAVVAEGSWWHAQQALKELPIEWNLGDNAKVSSASIMEFLRGGITAKEAPVSRQEGDIDKAFTAAAKVVEAEYYAPYLEHATMEPQNCTVYILDGRVEVWAPSQNSEATAALTAEVTEIPVSKVEVHKVHIGGGFGRRGLVLDFVRQAATIAKAVPGKPVKLIWSREEDIQHGYYRPVALVKMRAALDATNQPTAWYVRQADQSIFNAVRPEAIKNGIDSIGVRTFSDAPYAFPNIRMEYAMRNTHVPPGPWRAVAHTHNPFFRECFIDELAVTAGQDPYQFRRKLLAKATRDLGVLDAVAKAANWEKALPAGVHRGIAVQDAYGSYTAAVAEVSVSDKGELKIQRLVIGLDSGYVVNPDSVRAQVEGCVVYGLTAILYGEITIKEGRVEQSNFHDYPMMRIAEMPKVEVVLAPTGGFWGGAGEPPLAPLAPAICNAIFAATGKRIRSLPLKHHDLRKA